MIPPYPSPTPTWHLDVYPSISESRPELSAAGKTVIITGAGSGIGRQTALTFAAAGASRLILLGRDETKLAHTRSLVLESSSSPASPIAICEIFPVSVSDEKAMREIASKVGAWDILILGAGFLSTPAPITETPVDEWWESFETNVKGTIIAANAFLPTARAPLTKTAATTTDTNAVILSITTAATVFPPAMTKGLSSYVCSKTAMEKVIEFLSIENSHGNKVFCANVHPGFIETNTFAKSGGDAGKLPMATVQLPAHFLLWMSSPEARFLNGRTVWANWDVDELKARADEIEAGRLLTIGLDGWPFPNLS